MTWGSINLLNLCQRGHQRCVLSAFRCSTPHWDTRQALFLVFATHMCIDTSNSSLTTLWSPITLQKYFVPYWLSSFVKERHGEFLRQKRSAERCQQRGEGVKWAGVFFRNGNKNQAVVVVVLGDKPSSGPSYLVIWHCSNSANML